MGRSGRSIRITPRQFFSCLLIFTGILAALPLWADCGKVWTVGVEPLMSVKAVLAQAAPKDTIVVLKGTYLESNLVVDKPLTVLAQPGAIIDAQGTTDDIFVVVSDSVEISGFEFRGVGTSYLKEIAAIKVRESKLVAIRNNTIEACFFGVYLEYAQHVLVEGNRITGYFEEEVSAGNAIHAWKCDSLSIINNVAVSYRDGIYFEFVNDSHIECNLSRDNIRYGLHFMFSNRDVYKNNTFEKNGAGVAVMFSKKIEMTDNQFLNNWGGASYGLLLKEISDGTIAGNVFFNNTIGILAEGANRLLIRHNQFTRNGVGVDVKGNCLDNKVLYNNFLANSFEVVTNSQNNNNHYEANYWSGYSGYDLNQDDYGDVPYRPVNIFSKITHEIPSASFMLHSNIVDMLEAGEKIFPQLIPAELTDERPRMLPYSL